MEKNIQRLILKNDDILVIKMPMSLFIRRKVAKGFYEQIKKKLLPRKNKILLLPDEIELSVIGEKEVKEYISNIDLWSLWDEDG